MADELHHMESAATAEDDEGGRPSAAARECFAVIKPIRYFSTTMKKPLELNLIPHGYSNAVTPIVRTTCS
ncbi:hypothetical protein GGD50_002878 [Rhizobium paranaense]|uniref:Uncharacterized protein n=1 Tax=Rhizobium paranaense TaxID=1650438 RepID=A0A7W9D1V4_9HYPH|nr:hypothetical protein [Rhizobium paranaense]